ncbi:hypothetical protein LEP1GSC036_2209 [Leptospira weilii str. 2006001853]|uniref:Uncharacterized protein n=2 Tax=Leptospira weilii TaxID=28184 RepID=A0A828YYW0_9LEPT|nr:hypothetical protein LEP1GSC036_3798 [Leptospira weilii str. 2006001853]EKR63409.1 hypothetical protein LEP1GSC036_2209 [Leptospira weilii str. 2006001853]EMJ60219.1 hypothetical protein LEP1GSC051_0176 [Leptospira sp. P2653]EMM72830.1 hypothetical protein LEP1GSC038_1974 [Leptospira weilii str. 2006001855]
MTDFVFSKSTLVFLSVFGAILRNSYEQILIIKNIILS